MKVFVLVDEQNIVRCMASEECNLHSDKLYMDKYYVERSGTVGDEYDAVQDKWIPRPENYPKPSEGEINEAKIREKIREMAIEELKAEGELPPDYKEV